MFWKLKFVPKYVEDFPIHDIIIHEMLQIEFWIEHLYLFVCMLRHLPNPLSV